MSFDLNESIYGSKRQKTPSQGQTTTTSSKMVSSERPQIAQMCLREAQPILRMAPSPISSGLLVHPTPKQPMIRPSRPKDGNIVPKSQDEDDDDDDDDDEDSPDIEYYDYENGRITEPVEGDVSALRAAHPEDVSAHPSDENKTIKAEDILLTLVTSSAFPSMSPDTKTKFMEMCSRPSITLSSDEVDFILKIWNDNPHVKIISSEGCATPKMAPSTPPSSKGAQPKIPPAPRKKQDGPTQYPWVSTTTTTTTALPPPPPPPPTWSKPVTISSDEKKRKTSSESVRPVVATSSQGNDDDDDDDSSSDHPDGHPFGYYYHNSIGITSMSAKKQREIEKKYPDCHTWFSNPMIPVNSFDCGGYLINRMNRQMKQFNGKDEPGFGQMHRHDVSDKSVVQCTWMGRRTDMSRSSGRQVRCTNIFRLGCALTEKDIKPQHVPLFKFIMELMRLNNAKNVKKFRGQLALGDENIRWCDEHVLEAMACPSVCELNEQMFFGYSDAKNKPICDHIVKTLNERLLVMSGDRHVRTIESSAVRPCLRYESPLALPNYIVRLSLPSPIPTPAAATSSGSAVRNTATSVVVHPDERNSSVSKANTTTTSSNPFSCCICMDTAETIFSTTTCGHIFHSNCILKVWHANPKGQCPVCRMKDTTLIKLHI
jgi:hypothetical protein